MRFANSIHRGGSLATWLLNPYTDDGLPSLGPARARSFLGRDLEKETICNAVTGGRCLMVVGQRLLGKTSLLLNAVAGMYDRNGLVGVYIDCRSELGLSAIGEFKCLLAVKAREALGNFSGNLKSDLESEDQFWVDVEQYQQNANSRLLLLIENIEVLYRFDRPGACIKWLQYLNTISPRIQILVSATPGTALRLWEDCLADMDLLHLQRLKPNRDLHTGLHEMWLTRWGEGPEPEVIEAIIQKSTGHPFYLSALLMEIFSATKSIYESSAVDGAWEKVLGYRFIIDDRLQALNINQRRLLYELARTSTRELYSGGFLKKIGLNKGQVAKAIRSDGLTQWVHRNGDGYYEVIDPLVCALACENI